MYAALGAGCDAVVFLVFNKFDSDCKTQTFGHEFGGVSDGGMCEQNQGRGYTVVVDQVQCISVICEQDHPLTFAYDPTDTMMIVYKDYVMFAQGFLGDAWTGPQILAHHLLLMLTSDLRDQSKTCPNKVRTMSLYLGDT